jgi:hypothetical protein
MALAYDEGDLFERFEGNKSKNTKKLGAIMHVQMSRNVTAER